MQAFTNQQLIDLVHTRLDQTPLDYEDKEFKNMVVLITEGVNLGLDFDIKAKLSQQAGHHLLGMLIARSLDAYALAQYASGIKTTEQLKNARNDKDLHLSVLGDDEFKTLQKIFDKIEKNIPQSPIDSQKLLDAYDEMKSLTTPGFKK